jgi:hypothetical protein
MATLINSNKTDVMFVNNGFLVNSIPPPVDSCVHKCDPRASPYDLCGLPVVLRGLALHYTDPRVTVLRYLLLFYILSVHLLNIILIRILMES